MNIEHFKKFPNEFTVMDIRNPSEVKSKNIFVESLKFPLYELRERIGEIPTDKSIVVHCEGGYRSAAGASIIKNLLKSDIDVFDLGEAIKTF